MAAVFVGVAVAKWKASRSPHAQGFVEVDQVSVENVRVAFQSIKIACQNHDLTKSKRFKPIFIDSQTAVGVPVTPEERHVANMQINGYENPTYKYFEVKE
jgi:amyloid beta A4 protein